MRLNALFAVGLPLLVSISGSVLAGRPGRVADTVHNLSVSGPGRIKAVKETRICIFCHAPHTKSPAGQLWNRNLPMGPFLTIETGGGSAGPETSNQPNGASKMCLSCHDGTLALGAVLSSRKPIELTGTSTGTIPPGSRGFIGRDLRGMHPISIRVTPEVIARHAKSAMGLVPLKQMKSDPDVKLDRSDRIQCTTCHDPHDDSNYASSGIHFYTKKRFSDACVVCHR